MTDQDPRKAERIERDDEMRYDMRITPRPLPEMAPFFDPPLPTRDHNHGPITDEEFRLLQPLPLRRDIQIDQTTPEPRLWPYRPAGFDARMRSLFDEYRAPTELGRFEDRIIRELQQDRLDGDTTSRQPALPALFQGPPYIDRPPTPLLRPAAERQMPGFLALVRDWLAARGLIIVAPAPEDE